MTPEKEIVQQIVGAAARFVPDDGPDHHRNAPRPDPACLYGLVGEVARAGSESTEANPYAIALNLMAYLSAAIGRGAYSYIGNTRHHARMFGLHVGRSGRGRKGDAVSLVHRLDMAIRAADEYIAPQVHTGGLSTREGLALMIHDGWTQGKTEVEPIHDKRLLVVEPEFANVLHQGKRDGNTLSSALRDAWDGGSIKPATKGQPRVWASNPHICLSAAITPGELHGLMAARELTNGFANRFLTIWAERTVMLPFPSATPQKEVDALARRMIEVIRFAGGDRFAERDVQNITMSAAAQSLFARLYLSELNDQSAGDKVTSLLERRAPVLRRLALLFALCDLERQVDVRHVEAALAWTRYWTDSVRFIFSDGAAEVATAEMNATAQKILEFLVGRNKATRWELSKECFGGHQSKAVIDAALDDLLSASPPRIEVDTVPRPKGTPGTATKIYRLAAKSAKSAKRDQPRAPEQDLSSGEVCGDCEVSAATLRTLSTRGEVQNEPGSRASIDGSLTSQTSLVGLANGSDPEGANDWSDAQISHPGADAGRAA
jgi:hypothetical protein